MPYAAKNATKKTCARCRARKPLSGFHKNKGKPDGLSPTCKICRADIERRYKYKERYGITPEQFDKLLKKQKGKCATCGLPARDRHGRFHVDHDHETGTVRGLLCYQCNIVLGLVKDDPKVLRNLATYVERWVALRS